MPIEFSGPLLLTSHAGEYRPLGFGGEPVHGNYRKLAAVIESRLGPAAARYLARPEIHEASRSIGWHATVDGPVRRWSELTPTEQANLGPVFESLQAKLQGLVHDLEAAGPSTRGAQENFGHALRLALRSPGMDNLFFVGGQPVLTLWGFEGGSGSGFDSLSFRPQVNRSIPAAEVAVVAARPWWRWLLWLLGLLLLLLLLLFLLHSCLRVPVPLVDKFLPQSLAPVPDTPETPNPTPNGTTVVGPNGTTTVGPGGTATGTENGTVTVPGEAGTTTGTTTPGSEGVVPGTTPGTEGTTNGVEPDQGTQNQGNQNQGNQNQNPETQTPNDQNQANKNQADQNKADQNKENPNQSAQDKNKQNQEQQNQQNNQNSQNQPPNPQQPQNQAEQNQPPNPEANGLNQPTQGLKIPPPGSTGQSLGFLQGEWRSKSGLFDRATGKPLRQTYSFDNQGNGTVTIYRSDSSQCKGQAQAQLSGKGGLTIQDSGPIACPDGTSYAPSVTKCTQGSTGDATCTGVNKSGSTYHVEIVR